MDLMKYWEKEEPYYELLNQLMKKKIEQLLKSNKIKANINRRVKKELSLRRKLLMKGNTEKAYNSIADKSGIRIICSYISDLDLISEIIKNNFDVVKYDDKRKEIKPNWIGYQAIHVEIRFKKNERNIKKEIKNLISEVQIKTALQAAWGDNTHDLTYKNDIEIPPNIERRVNLLNAIIEVADNEFDNIRKQIKEMDTLSIYGILFILNDIFRKEFNIHYNVNFTIYFIEKFHAFFKANFSSKKFDDEISKFLDKKLEIFKHIYEKREPIEDESIFFNQPELILIYYLLEKDQFNFKKEWSKYLNYEMLEIIATWFGLSIS